MFLDVRTAYFKTNLIISNVHFILGKFYLCWHILGIYSTNQVSWAFIT